MHVKDFIDVTRVCMACGFVSEYGEVRRDFDFEKYFSSFFFVSDPSARLCLNLWVNNN